LAVAAGRAQRAGGTVGTRRQTDDGGDGGDEPVGNTTTTVANPDADAKATPGRPAIRPRADWGSESPPNGTLRIIDDDLLIVTTPAPEGASSPAEVPTLIRPFNFQTSGDLAWPDIGFNFIVDEFARREGRQGSIDALIACETEGGDLAIPSTSPFWGSSGRADAAGDGGDGVPARLAGQRTAWPPNR
jgi:hypothetical protein